MKVSGAAFHFMSWAPPRARMNSPQVSPENGTPPSKWARMSSHGAAIASIRGMPISGSQAPQPVEPAVQT